MEASTYFVGWNKLAQKQTKALHDYISKDSEKETDKVLDAIIAIVDRIPEHPTKHPPDKYRKANDGTFRAFQKYKYRVAYRTFLQRRSVFCM